LVISGIIQTSPPGVNQNKTETIPLRVSTRALPYTRNSLSCPKKRQNLDSEIIRVSVFVQIKLNGVNIVPVIFYKKIRHIRGLKYLLKASGP